jgi:hypothetical protein
VAGKEKTHFKQHPDDYNQTPARSENPEFLRNPVK